MEDKVVFNLKTVELATALKVGIPTIRKWTLEGMPCEHWGRRIVRFNLALALEWLKISAELHAERKLQKRHDGVPEVKAVIG